LRAQPAAAAYLHRLRPGETLNLLGPFGTGFQVDARTRTLLLAADRLRAPLLLPLIESLLDKGGRVALLLDGGSEPAPAVDPLLPLLPLPVEARVEPHASFAAALAAMAVWADQICLALPMRDYAQVAAVVRTAKPRILPGAVQALVEAPLPCGVGACLACVIPLAGGGHTRACLHGPVFDLARLV
jgi:dihydroorotate dehydrogenase electron transfer subunit